MRCSTSVILVCALTLSTPTVPDISTLLSALALGGYASGERPPDFVGLTVRGQPVRLADLRGRVVVVNFWATWCPSCGAELAQFQEIHRTFGSEHVVVVAVNLGEPAPLVHSYVDALGVTFTVLVDPRGEIRREYGVIGVPTTFIIGRDGRAVARAIGPREWAGPRSLELLRTLLNEAANLDSRGHGSGWRPATHSRATLCALADRIGFTPSAAGGSRRQSAVAVSPA